MVDVDIEYCVPCGHLDRAQQLEGAILSEYGQQVNSVRLVTGDSGVFEVTVDGDLVFDVAEDDYDEDAIVASVGEYV